MTLRPAEDVRLSIPPQDCWIEYDIPPVCQVPGCQEPWAHRHHIVRRTKTGGPQRWVAVDGVVLPNVMGICFRHHEQVTGMVGGHWARIGFPSIEELTGGLYRPWWVWYSRVPSPGLEPVWHEVGPIDSHVY